MFCTLKMGNGAGEPYAFEATPPPFSKKREGKTSKVACTNCRISKLRCSGDPGCCRRCSNKKVQCEYPSPPRSNSQSKEQSPQPATVIDTDASLSPLLAESPYDITYSESLPDAIHDFIIPDLPTPNAAASLRDDSVGGQISLDIESFWRKEQLPIEAGSQSFEHTTLTEIGDINLSLESAGSLSGPEHSETSSQSACSCFKQAMSTNEAIEVIIWGQQETLGDVYSILQQQKAALAKCEDLLECRGCNAQPPYVMMLLSMCRNLLATLDRVCQRPSGVETRGIPTSSERNVECQKKRKIGEGDDGGVDFHRTYGNIIRERKLDDDDELSVLRSLVSVRVRMLSRILGKLDRVVSNSNWPVHKDVCRELHKSLSTRPLA